MILVKSGNGAAALTQVTEAAAHVTISIPAGKGGVLKAVELQTLTVDETVVDGGGLVKLTNSSADWTPFELLTPKSGVVTLGGSQKLPYRYDCEKELPGNSSVYASYTPYDNQSQRLRVTLIWELGAKIREETFHASIHPLKAAAVTATARASPGNVQIPGGKGGRLYKIYWMNWPTAEAILQSSGLVELENNAFDMTPHTLYGEANQVVGAGGDIVGGPWCVPVDIPCPQNSTFTSYLTPDDDQSQTESTILAWKRDVRRSVA